MKYNYLLFVTQQANGLKLSHAPFRTYWPHLGVPVPYRQVRVKEGRRDMTPPPLLTNTISPS